MKAIIASVLFLSLQTYVQGQVQCDFEGNSICNFVQASDDNEDWTVFTGRTATTNTGPTQAAAGTQYYVYFETSDPVVNGAVARLETPAVGFSGSGCVRFWYHMYGSDLGQFNVRLGSTSLLALTGDQGNTWKQIEADVTVSSSNDRLTFEAIRGTGIRSDVAVDEVMVTSGFCGDGVVPPFVCDFETQDICGFTQSDTDVFDWTRNSGPTATSNTGPSSAATGTNYMYIETSDPRVEGDNAILVSPSMSVNGDVCLTFQYHMYGSAIGTLNVRTSASSSNVWTRRGDQGNQWSTASVTLPMLTGTSILFEGIRGNAIQGDIALDDIRVASGSCSGAEPTTTTTTTTAPIGTANLPIVCGFENDFCNLEQSTSDQFDWTRQSGGTQSGNTGPDGAFEGNFYIYTEASSPRAQGDEAKLETKRINAAGDICIRFNYHLFGTTVGRFYVYTSGRSSLPLLDLSGQLGNMWNDASLDASIANGDRVYFVGVRSTDVFGDIAMDNVRITGGRCTTGIDLPAVFDVRSCDSESSSSSTCRMVQDTSSDNFDWSMNELKTPSAIHFREINGQKYPITGPSSAQSGLMYIYAEASGRSSGDISRVKFEGSDFNRGGDNCLRFFYMMNGFHVGELSAYVIRSGTRVKLWSVQGDKLQNWFKANVDIDMDGVSEVGLQATMTGLFNGDIAVDSVQMTSFTCEGHLPEDVQWRCRMELDDGSSSLCGMEQDTNDAFDWTMGQGDTKSMETGPSGAQSGNFYIFIEASSPRVEGDSANIMSPVIGRGGVRCVSFRYSMYGFHTGSLRLSIRSSGGSVSQIWEQSGDKGQGWQSARVTANGTGSYRIMFTGVRGTGYSGDIALDTIQVTPRSCGCC